MADGDVFTDEELADILRDWPNCATPDCDGKVCSWGSRDRCHRCEERRSGPIELLIRYAATHDPDGQWSGARISSHH